MKNMPAIRTYRNPTFATTNAYRYGFTDDQLVPFVAAIECTISLNREGNRAKLFLGVVVSKKWWLHLCWNGSLWRIRQFLRQSGSITKHSYRFCLWIRWRIIQIVDKSPYSAFWNNPIKYNDPDGRCPICSYIIIGFLMLESQPASTHLEVIKIMLQ